VKRKKSLGNFLPNFDLKNMTSIDTDEQIDTHVQSDCESSTGSSSSAAHPSPLMSTRGRELSLHLRQQRLQLLSSNDGGFNYIRAAKAAKAANHMVCNTVSSTWNSESVVVLYRGGPI
jgi:hypothetical protein